MAGDNGNEDKSIRLEDLAQVKEVPSVETARLSELQKEPPSPQEIMMSQIPYELAKAYCMVPIALRENAPTDRTITVVVADPQNNKPAIDYLRKTVVWDDLPKQQEMGLIKYNVRILTAPKDQIESAIERLYYDEASHLRVAETVLPLFEELEAMERKTGGQPGSLE